MVGYLHNAVEELNSGLPITNPGSSRMEDLNRGPPDFKTRILNHSPPITSLKNHTLKSPLSLRSPPLQDFQ